MKASSVKGPQTQMSADVGFWHSAAHLYTLLLNLCTFRGNTYKCTCVHAVHHAALLKLCVKLSSAGELALWGSGRCSARG